MLKSQGDGEQKVPVVSVIVPVYQGKEHFRELLSCLRGQTLEGMELIFVDDVGQDGTFALAEEAARQDSRVVCVHASCNGGPGHARNLGIEVARGEYIAFADADDVIPETFYERLYKTARRTGALVVKGSRAALYPDGMVEESQANANIRLRRQQGAHLMNSFAYEHTTALFRRSLVEQTGARNADARQDEDTVFLLMVLCHLNWEQFAFCSDALYYYRKHPQSISSAKDERYLKESLRSMKAKLDFLMAQPDSPAVAEYAAGTIENRLYQRFKEVRDRGSLSKQAANQYISAVQDMIAIYVQAHSLQRPARMTRLALARRRSPQQLISSMRRREFYCLWRNRGLLLGRHLANLFKSCHSFCPLPDRDRNVALLNFAGGCNYGANLTAYALMKAVEKLGFHARLINRRFLYRRLDVQGQFFRFGQKYLQWTVPCYGREHFKLLNRQFRTFIVGSDQVWTYQPDWFSQPVQFRDVFDLEFTGKDQRRIAMAASLGDNATYDAAPEDFCAARSAALKRFQALSVREVSAVPLCREKWGVEVQHVLDPVFLLTAEEWAALADDAKVKFPQRFLATCVLHAPLRPFVEQVSQRCAAAGLASVDLMRGEVVDWLKLVQRSEWVVTDSFHVTCFAIIFQKPVLFLNNEVRGGDCVPSLLKTLGVTADIISASEVRQQEEAMLERVMTLFRTRKRLAVSQGRLEAERSKTASFLAQALQAPTEAQKEALAPIDRNALAEERRIQRCAYCRELVQCMALWLGSCAVGLVSPRFRLQWERRWQAVQRMWEGMWY